MHSGGHQCGVGEHIRENYKTSTFFRPSPSRNSPPAREHHDETVHPDASTPTPSLHRTLIFAQTVHVRVDQSRRSWGQSQEPFISSGPTGDSCVESAGFDCAPNRKTICLCRYADNHQRQTFVFASVPIFAVPEGFVADATSESRAEPGCHTNRQMRVTRCPSVRMGCRRIGVSLPDGGGACLVA